MLSMIYLLVFLFPQIHEIQSHSEEKKAICSLEEESNPCHQAIYHFESSSSCEHSNHISAEHDSCELCDSIFNQSHSTSGVDYFISSLPFAKAKVSSPNSLKVYFSGKFYLERGPPSLFI